MATGSSKSLRIIIIANAVVFATAALTDFFAPGVVAPWLVLSSALGVLAERPWTLISYMFTQADVLHILFNMLWLYCFGSILDRLRPPATLWASYLGGGVAGGIVYLAVAGLSGTGGALMGSSAAVLAVAVYTGLTAPQLPLTVWPFGPVRLKWIVAVMVVVFCIGFTGTPAATAAHAGGAVFGGALWCASHLSQRSSHENMQAELDSLLGRVKTSGYDALSAADKRRLFQLSYKLKK